jgi:hypothetical protein
MRPSSMSASVIGIAAVVGALVLVAVMWLVVLTRVGDQPRENRDLGSARQAPRDE